MKLKLALALISSFIIFETQAQRDKPDIEKVKKGDLTIQPVNQIQLAFVMPVSRYIQVITPINGISENFFINANIESNTAQNQNMISETFGVARSIKVFLPEI